MEAWRYVGISVTCTLCYIELQVYDGGAGLAEQSLHGRVDGGHSDGVTLCYTVLHCYRYMREMLGYRRYLAWQSSHFTVGRMMTMLMVLHYVTPCYRYLMEVLGCRRYLAR